MSLAAAPPASATLVDRLRTAEPMLLLLRASLLLVLVNSHEDRSQLVLVAIACVVVLPREPVLRSTWFWAAAFGLIGTYQLLTWHTIDDHVIATTYWCGAIALALGAREPLRTLAWSARWLVGALFVFAAGWKLLSGQFVDGTFFRYSLLFDDRFATVARALGGTSKATLDANVDAVNALLSGSGDGVVQLREGPRNEAVAWAFTWWGVFIESAVALTFVAPLRERWTWLRHAALVGFAATTYLVVPIGGFGSLLLVLGATMARTANARTAYLGGAGVLLLWTLIWPVVAL